MIVAKDLQKVYTRAGDTQIKALDGVDVTIEKGEFVGITGPGGSGKSTLLCILGLLDIPSRGSIEIDGVDTGMLNSDERSMFRLYKLGYVFPDPALFSDLTVLENTCIMAMLRNDVTPEACLSASTDLLNRIGLYDRRTSFPAELTVHEQLRVAVARAAVSHPDVLFADDPCANLNPVDSRGILEFFRELNETMNQTIVMVSRDDRHNEYFHRIIPLCNGKIVGSDDR